MIDPPRAMDRRSDWLELGWRSMAEWSLEDAKSQFQAVVEAAMQGTPQRLRSEGRAEVVVIDATQFDRLERLARHAPSLPDLLLSMPRGEGEFVRIDVAPRRNDD